MLSIGAIMLGTSFVPAQYHRNARFAEKPSRITPIGNESIAVMPAILQPGIIEVSVMTKEQFQRESAFQATMCSVAQMRNAGIITDAEYEKCREMMLEKYNPPFGKIVSN